MNKLNISQTVAESLEEIYINTCPFQDIIDSLKEGLVADENITVSNVIKLIECHQKSAKISYMLTYCIDELISTINDDNINMDKKISCSLIVNQTILSITRFVENKGGLQ